MHGIKISAGFLFISLAMTLGCGNSEPEPESMATSPPDVKQEAREAIETVKIYSQEQMRNYRNGLRNELGKLERSHQELQAKLEDMKEGTKKDIEQVIKDLNEKKRDLEHKTEELQMATGQAFGDMKRGIDQALAELEEAYKQAIQRFSS